MNFKEDDENMYFQYNFTADQFTLIYNKDKDICLILKNGTKADIKKLRHEEVERYKDVLCMAINYHHDREDINFYN